jgi:hypothetical protein
MKKVIIKYHNEYLQAFMPNGDLIPLQTDMKIENSTEQSKEATVTITFIADITQMGELIRVDCDHKGVIADLEEKLKNTNNHLLTYKELYNEEVKKSWYKKLFEF